MGPITTTDTPIVECARIFGFHYKKGEKCFLALPEEC